MINEIGKKIWRSRALDAKRNVESEFWARKYAFVFGDEMGKMVCRN